jgi:acyl-CoA thioesterase YciA
MTDSLPDEISPPDQTPAIRTIAMPKDANASGDIFGGWLLSQMDLAGGSAAAHVAKGRCATVAISDMTFLKPVFIGDEVSLFATVTKVGRTSITISVEAWRRRLASPQMEKVTQGAFVFVALDQNHRPRPVEG